jgi:hypothetical protein
MGWTTRGSNPGRGKSVFCCYLKRPDRCWVVPSLLLTGHWFYFPGVKRPKREVYHLCPFRISGAILPFLLFVFVAWIETTLPLPLCVMFYLLKLRLMF